MTKQLLINTKKPLQGVTWPDKSCQSYNELFTYFKFDGKVIKLKLKSTSIKDVQYKIIKKYVSNDVHTPNKTLLMKQ